MIKQINIKFETLYEMEAMINSEDYPELLNEYFPTYINPIQTLTLNNLRLLYI